jgi:hypothetical protein
MANPIAPTDGDARRIPFLVDPANPGVPYLAVGSGAISMGAGRTLGAVPGALGWGLGSDGVPLQHHVADKFVPFALTAVTTEQLAWTPGTGKKVRLLAIHLKASVETTIAILDGTGGSTMYTVGAEAGKTITLPLGPIGVLSALADNVLYLTSSAEADIAGTLSGCEE